MESSIFVSVPNKGVKLQVKVDVRFYLSQTVCIFYAFSNAPNPGWMNTLMRFAEFDVDVIVASHNGNALDPLETGNKESLNKQLQFLQV